MQLDSFRRVLIEADTANGARGPVVLSQNDHDGRVIRFELWDGAQAADPEGLTARLLFNVDPENPDSSGGYVTMTEVSDAQTATWEVPVPSEALAEPGRVMLAVEVSDGTRVVCTRNFEGVVERALINEDSPEAQDALSEFREAVERIGDLGPATAERLGLVMVGDGLSVDQDGVLSADMPDPVPITHGGTGATSASGARTNLGAASASSVTTLSGRVTTAEGDIDALEGRADALEAIDFATFGGDATGGTISYSSSNDTVNVIASLSSGDKRVLNVTPTGPYLSKYTASSESWTTVWDMRKPLFKMGGTNFTIGKAQGSGSANVTAPTESGYSFLCWVMCSTSGWVGDVYAEHPDWQTTKFWTGAGQGSGNGTVWGAALYVRSAFYTPAN